MSRIIVAGALANRPANGGGASVRMTWVEGLRRLGFEVWFVEQVDRGGLAPAKGSESSSPVHYFESVTERHGLAGQCALLDLDGGVVSGASLEELQTAARDATLVNLGGHLRLPTLLERFSTRVFVDLDPGFTQFWHAEGLDCGGLENHDHFFTVGLNVAGGESDVPTGDLPWRSLLPPVVLDEWATEGGELDSFTTVASWRGTFGPVTHRGRTFGLKAHEFRRFIGLPERLPAASEIVLDIHPGDSADLDALRERGWRVVDPRQRVPDPDSYREYIRSSGAELSVAQGIYVETASGWFSDRTARYLAAGKPALVQETGFARHLPVGEGLVSFGTPAEAVEGAARIASDYGLHGRRARELAEEHLDSDRVLGQFCEEVGVSP